MPTATVSNAIHVWQYSVNDIHVWQSSVNEGTTGMCQRVISPDDHKSQCSSIIRKDPFVGNVSKVAPLPKGHTGPVQKGQLVFDACFESGESRPPRSSRHLTCS